ncbi:Uu.00g140080.m01.CDS01 [Anthostomella pinea]|uniref:Uu.00g140080.m01.CDS01 n=1 Tax=Anthostomella pinea TaxID=933095 RepID=A0AAI8VR77_9PEZI|nr:Uu.00g140080.m01.CDS01 [Anthostomella pinea]
MAPQKRKRPHDHVAATEPTTAPPPARRATRQHPSSSDAPPPSGTGLAPKHGLRSGRLRAKTVEKTGDVIEAPAELEAVRGVAPRSINVANPPLPRQTRTTREKYKDKGAVKEDSNIVVRPPTSPSPPRDIRIHTTASSPKHPVEGVRNLTLEAQPRARTHHALQSSPLQGNLRLSGPSQRLPHASRTIHAESLAQTAPIRAVSKTKTQTQTPKTPRRPSPGPKPLPPPTPWSDRNIDKVVLGDICFRAWYPSYYGKEVLGDLSGNATTASGAGSKENSGVGHHGMTKIGGGKTSGVPMLDRLYVCPCCFKYSKELVSWWEHVRCCERTFEMPGRKVYTHPRGLRGVKVPGASGGDGRSKGKRRGDGGAHGSEPVVSDHGEWSVWEVDGEKDMLFCQNLSLFAKLFLDNKSVFFDVTGFNYFLLVYTPPDLPTEPETHTPHNSPPDLTQQRQDRPDTSTQTSTSTASSPVRRLRVVGFFSKEKMSWDNNNLACILVFPPWQRKGLGALLMGVSYAISRREGILGGPEKPISELGRKGYRRFWAGEIARWLLGLNLDFLCTVRAVGAGVGGGMGKEKGGRKDQHVALVDVDRCSRDTWIAPDDCLSVLREMGVVEEVPPELKGVEVVQILKKARTEDDDDDDTPMMNDDAESSKDDKEKAAEKEKEGKSQEATTTTRVRVDKAAVRGWVHANGIELSRTCDPDGFVEGYAVRAVEGVEDDG